eukprot:m.289184 g.289184  ORF g.289184 m.289184 type:complete len:65 (-) comp12087_c0_seq1:8-202(-)
MTSSASARTMLLQCTIAASLCLPGAGENAEWFDELAVYVFADSRMLRIAAEGSTADGIRYHRQG